MSQANLSLTKVSRLSDQFYLDAVNSSAKQPVIIYNNAAMDIQENEAESIKNSARAIAQEMASQKRDKMRHIVGNRKNQILMQQVNTSTNNAVRMEQRKANSSMELQPII